LSTTKATEEEEEEERTIQISGSTFYRHHYSANASSTS
jgi:hypothetical protein